MPRKLIQIGDKAKIGNRTVKVISPYKVKSHWQAITISDLDPKLIGEIRVYSGGTLALNRIKA